MKITKTLLFLVALSLLALPIVNALPKKDYNTITEGEILYSSGHYLAGTPIPTGFDIYGYNYQGHLFKGSYFNVYSGGAGFPPYEGDDEAYLAANPNAASDGAWPYRDTQLLMKWNDAWLSNMDRDDADDKLDRHYGYTSYIGSGAWETNHMWGDNPDGTQWNYYCKIVAVPEGAYLDDPYNPDTGEYTWYFGDGTMIGKSIWGEFAITFEVSNDPSIGDHGAIYNAPAPTGFGYYKP
jgi:hypothetical protein